MTDEQQILLRHEVRGATRGRFHQTMGELRAMAARMAAKGLTDDEEGYFRGLVAEYFYVERQEAAKLFGIAQADALLDIFKLHRDEDQILDGDTTSTG
jgi:hypothetical protein